MCWKSEIDSAGNSGSPAKRTGYRVFNPVTARRNESVIRGTIELVIAKDDIYYKRIFRIIDNRKQFGLTKRGTERLYNLMDSGKTSTQIGEWLNARLETALATPDRTTGRFRAGRTVDYR